jgi:hypothetical protein
VPPAVDAVRPIAPPAPQNVLGQAPRIELVSGPARTPSSVPGPPLPLGRVASAIGPGASFAAERAKQVAVEVATGELGEGVLSPEYNELEQQYIREPRDGSWARPQEDKVLALFEGHPLQHQVVLVHCQETVCRIVVEGSDAAAFKQLLTVPDLQDVTGIAAGTPYSLRTGQLSVFFRRSDKEIVGR